MVLLLPCGVSGRLSVALLVLAHALLRVKFIMNTCPTSAKLRTNQPEAEVCTQNGLLETPNLSSVRWRFILRTESFPSKQDNDKPAQAEHGT